MSITLWIRALRAAAILALLLPSAFAQAQAKWEPGLSHFSVPRSVIVTREEPLVSVRKGPRPDSPECLNCGLGYTAGFVGQTRTTYRIIFGDIAAPEYGYIAKSDAKLLRRPFRLRDRGFFAHDLTSTAFPTTPKMGSSSPS